MNLSTRRRGQHPSAGYQHDSLSISVMIAPAEVTGYREPYERMYARGRIHSTFPAPGRGMEMCEVWRFVVVSGLYPAKSRRLLAIPGKSAHFLCSHCAQVKI
jgi:hypothetical protein